MMRYTKNTDKIMPMDKEKNKNVIEHNFKAENNFSAPFSIPKKQTNPIQENFVKLVFSKLKNNKLDYKSFSKFNPKDLK